jgi:hypothetical protein
MPWLRPSVFGLGILLPGYWRGSTSGLTIELTSVTCGEEDLRWIIANRAASTRIQPLRDNKLVGVDILLIQNKDFLGAGFLSVVFLFSAPAQTQTTPSGEHAVMPAATTTQDGVVNLQSVAQDGQGPTGSNGNGFNSRIVSQPTPLHAGNEVGPPENVMGHDFSSSAITENEVTQVAREPHLADKNLPPTLTVRTAALLELHAMRKSAVALCLELPTKYRTRLPQCAEIFKHEIRLTALAKNDH